MLRDRALVGSLAVGVVASLVGAGYWLTVPAVRPPDASAVPFVGPLAGAAAVVVPFAVGAGAAALAARYRIASPLSLVAVFAALPAVLGWNAEQSLVGVFLVGPLVVVAGIGDALVRVRFRQPELPLSEADLRALSVGIMAAVLYTGVFTYRVLLPLWRLGAGSPPTLPAGVDTVLASWYVFGVALVLVGAPVALNRRYGLLGPLVGLVAYLLADLAFVQPLVAEGAEPVVGLLVVVWPLLAALLAALGAVEWWVRARRGEYEQGGEDGDGGDPPERDLSVEEGLFGDRV
jgi:hypothetical protein